MRDFLPVAGAHWRSCPVFHVRGGNMDYAVFHRMGKVGSHSVLHSLRASAPSLRIDQSHFLTPQAIEKARQKVETLSLAPELAVSLRGQLAEALRCVEEVGKRRKQGNPYCVLSGYRD